MLGEHFATKQPRLALTQCVLSYVSRDTWRLLEDYALWRTFGEFPSGQPILEQPCELLDAFQIFELERKACSGEESPLTAVELVEILSVAFGGKGKR